MHLYLLQSDYFIRYNIVLIRFLAKACCEMSQRDGAIVAWHEVPGRTPPQKSRPVGYGLIRAGVRTDSMIRERLWPHMAISLAAPDRTVPYGRVLSRDAFPGTSCQATIGVVPTGQNTFDRRGFA